MGASLPALQLKHQTYMNVAQNLPVSLTLNDQWPPGSPFKPLDASPFILSGGDRGQPPVLEFERIDLNTRSQEKHYREYAERFLKAESVQSPCGESIALFDRWIDATWPQGQIGEFWLTKLPPVKGQHYWHLQPIITSTPGASAASSQVLQFRVFFKDGALVLLGFEPAPRGVVAPVAVKVRGAIHLDARLGRMTVTDRQRLETLPHFTPSAPARLSEWRNYLDWREKLAEENSKHRYPYGEWEVSKDQKSARFFLRGEVSVDLLKVRFQGQSLLALPSTGAAQRGVGSALFRAIEPTGEDKNRTQGSGGWRLKRPPSPGEPPPPTCESVIVVTLNEEQRERLKEGAGILFPDEGELAVDVSGELSAIRNQRGGIDRLCAGTSVNLHLDSWLFNSQKARTPDGEQTIETTLANLNAEQRKAVARTLDAPDVYYLQGPPGTGKTTVIGEVCRQVVQQGKRCLVSSQANLAVDNALAGLVPKGETLPMVRPLRWLEERREREVEEPFQRYLPRRVVRDWLNRVAAACEADLQVQAAGQNDLWRVFKQEWIKQLKSGAPGDRSEEAKKLYIRHANVVGATCNATGKIDFYRSFELDPYFDQVVVDEVSKATPPELLMPLLLGRRAMLVGDHRQLPPMFRSDTFDEAVANGEFTKEKLTEFKDMVTTSYFETSFLSAPAALRNTLKEQYRMHPQIMDVVNHFYPDVSGKGVLEAGGGREARHRDRQHDHTLAGRGSAHLLRPGEHVLWIDSTHNEFGGLVGEGAKRGTSRWNPFEVDLIEGFLSKVHTERSGSGKGGKLDVGVISFYLAQTKELRDRLSGRWSSLDVQVNTVDQFQGRECSVVIVSLVRSGEVSGEFVKDYRRINVAFSRAKQLLVIVGSRGAFAPAMIPVAPVEGGEPKPQKVYASIADYVSRNRGIRFPRDL